MKLKKLTALLSASILAVCALPMSAGAEVLKGDVNHDGFVDALDATLVCEYYSALSTGNEDEYTEEEHENYQTVGDFYEDGTVDPVDASFILLEYSKNS